MSGSGKSVALHALEDAGYYCVDNLPPELLLSFVALEQQQQRRSAWRSPWTCAAPRRCRWCRSSCSELRAQGVLGALAVPGRDHRHAGAALFRNAAPPSAVAAAGRRATATLATTSSTRWSMRSSSSANCWPTCASRRHVIDTSVIRPSQLQALRQVAAVGADQPAHAGVRVVRVQARHPGRCGLRVRRAHAAQSALRARAARPDRPRRSR